MIEVVPEDRYLCSMADPSGIVGGARSIKCEEMAVATGVVGEWLCEKHVASYPTLPS